MPVSAYLKAGLFVVAAAAALFAAAGTVAIPAFWAYLAIFALFAAFVAGSPPWATSLVPPSGSCDSALREGTKVV